MLNAELKSMNSILTYESFLSRCVRAGWRAVAMGIIVERWTYMQLEGVQGGGEGQTDVLLMTSHSKALHWNRSEATGR